MKKKFPPMGGVKPGSKPDPAYAFPSKKAPPAPKVKRKGK